MFETLHHAVRSFCGAAEGCDLVGSEMAWFYRHCFWEGKAKIQTGSNNNVVLGGVALHELGIHGKERVLGLLPLLLALLLDLVILVGSIGLIAADRILGLAHGSAIAGRHFKHVIDRDIRIEEPQLLFQGRVGLLRQIGANQPL